MKEIRKALAQIIRVSLNADQANHVAGMLDSKFDLFRASGFGHNIAIPNHVAAETILNHFRDEEDLVRFFELMINREGVFFFGSTVAIKGRDDFILLLHKKKWIFDRDLKMFFRDPFFSESLNFLKSVEFLDLRRDTDAAAITAQMKEHADKLKGLDLDWCVTLRLYGLSEENNQLVRSIIEMLLARQGMESHSYNFHTCLRELAINASKANYKHVFTTFMLEGGESEDYSQALSAFRSEIEGSGDQNLVKEAARRDVFFDLFFKSSASSISMWAINHIPLSRVEKVRIITKLNVNRLEDDSDSFQQEDDLREGAGLGINMTTKILASYYKGNDPLKVVFYPKSTKIGFVVKRTELEAAQVTGS